MFGLVADIGSTNARFALVDMQRGTPTLLYMTVLPTASYATLRGALTAYLKSVPADQRPHSATIAVAAPVSCDQVHLTNGLWNFSIAETKQEFAFGRLHVINDFTAISLSLRSLPSAAFAAIGSGSSTAEPHCLGAIGPGTGLGMGALLIKGSQITPLASEGGHATFAATTSLEADVVRLLRDRLGRVSNERILSGPGLVHIFEALTQLTQEAPIVLTPQEITKRAITHADSRCVQSLSFFCAALGSVAGDLALLLCADAIYVSGGIVPRIIDFLRLSAFREHFENKGRFAARAANIPTFVITDPQPGLIGAAVDLLQYL